MWCTHRRRISPKNFCPGCPLCHKNRCGYRCGEVARNRPDNPRSLHTAGVIHIHTQCSPCDSTACPHPRGRPDQHRHGAIPNLHRPYYCCLYIYLVPSLEEGCWGQSIPTIRACSSGASVSARESLSTSRRTLYGGDSIAGMVADHIATRLGATLRIRALVLV